VNLKKKNVPCVATKYHLVSKRDVGEVQMTMETIMVDTCVQNVPLSVEFAKMCIVNSAEATACAEVVARNKRGILV